MMMRRVLYTMTLLVLTPLAPALSGDEAQAASRVYVSGGITFAAPDFVLGFSYNDPYVLGHVHREPAYCDQGPLYYYPHYKVYGHYHPRYTYRYYARPHGHRHYVGPSRHGHRHHFDRGHRGYHRRHYVESYRHRGSRPDRHYRSERRRDDRRRDDRDNRRERRGQRVRGH